MIKIEANVGNIDDLITEVILDYEVDDAELGEYIAVLDKVKNEVLENSNIDEETLKEILFGKED